MCPEHGRETLTCCNVCLDVAADAVIHTAFDHSGVDFENAIRMDRSAIQTMTAAMAGTNKPFVMSSGTGLLGSTGPAPANEEFPIDPEIHLRHRVSSERVCVFPNQGAAASDLRALL